MKECLRVFLHRAAVGDIVRFDDGRIGFEFDDEYRNDFRRFTLSQSFVDADRGVRTLEALSSSGQLPTFFANLMPEGQLLTYIARAAGVRETQEFELLEYLGADLPGDVVVGQEGERSERRHLNSSRVEETEDLRFSLAGVQLKLSALVRRGGALTIPAHGLGGDWIVKFPSTVYKRMPENEYSVMAMAARVGIDVPETKLVPIAEIEGLPPEFSDFDDPTAFAIRRIDRTLERRIHMEDFAQALAQRPADKYNPQLNYSDLVRLVARVSDESDAIEISRRLMFSAIVGNGDMHLKNWTFIYPEGRTPHLSPGYDFLCTTVYIPGDSLALKLGTARHWKDLSLDDFGAVAESAGLDRDAFVNAAVDTAVKFRDAWDECSKSLPVDDALKLSIEHQMRICPAIDSALRQTQ